MFTADIPLLLRFWAALFLIGAAAYPLTRRFFSDWWDEGYLFTKAVGLASVTFISWYLASLRILPYTFESIVLAVIAVFLLGIIIYRAVGKTGKELFYEKARRKESVRRIIVSEIIFLALLLFWGWVKGHEASIQGLEKFMDYGFTKSVLNTRYFPAADMWYAGGKINYYYFGHVVMATVTRLSGVDLSYTFNFMLAALFALTATMSFSLGTEVFYLVLRKDHETVRFSLAAAATATGVITSFLLTLGGNLQTIYAFTRGYTGEDVKPFWELWWPAGEFFARLPEGFRTYWYANATRFIPFTIHEFPGYSFVVSDVHGHVLSLPFALLAIALLIALFSHKPKPNLPYFLEDLGFWFFGFLVGVMFMTNALDGLIYSGLFLILAAVRPSKERRWSGEYLAEKGRMLAGLFVAVPVVLPFAANFKSFVNGVAVNCPPAALSGSKFGPFLFEEAEKCQKSPLWMLFILWGFFIYTGLRLLWPVIRLWGERVLGQYYQIKISNQNNQRIQLTDNKTVQIRTLLLLYFVYSVVLVLFAEFFYFKDIYPAHFRSNTMFKLGYQAFLMFSVIAGVTIGREFLVRTKRRIGHHRGSLIYRLILLPQIFLVVIFPYFAVRSYFGELKVYGGLYGLTWLADRYPDDFQMISWFNSEIENGTFSSYQYRGGKFGPVIVEADGDSYTDYARVSAFTGLPTVIGWGVHEWLWRGTYDVVSPRREDVGRLYNATDLAAIRQLIAKYNIEYIIVGTIEREKFLSIPENLYLQIADVVFESGETRVYKIR